MTDTRHRPGAVFNYFRIAFSVAAVGLVVLGLFALRESSRSRGWLKTNGTILSSSVVSFTPASGKTSYRPMIVFSYSVGSARFMSNHLAFRSTATARRSDAESVVADYPAGRIVTVFYDPQDPERAVLDRGGNPWLPLLSGGAFSVLAVWMRILGGRAEKRAAAVR